MKLWLLALVTLTMPAWAEREWRLEMEHVVGAREVAAFKLDFAGHDEFRESGKHQTGRLPQDDVTALVRPIEAVPTREPSE
jgi:hypothetical protein